MRSFALNRLDLSKVLAFAAFGIDRRWIIAAGLLAAGVTIGCQSEQVDARTAELRQQFLVATEPSGALTLTELATQLGVVKPDEEAAVDQTDLASPANSAQSVVVVGRIFAGDMEPWDTGKASFLIAELPDEGHGEGHDADNCPFCKRKAAKAPTAIVQFVDATGQVIPIDARKLFGVDKKDVVVIRGQAAPGELTAMVVTATDMHVRSK
jgi:hypothetical protein